MPTRRPPVTEFFSLVEIGYQYQDIDIQAIMAARHDEIYEDNQSAFNKQVHILGAAHDPDNLKIILQGDKSVSSHERILLIPYHLRLNPNNKNSDHWVGILLEINGEGITDRALYIDSLQHNEPTILLQDACQEIYPGVPLIGSHYMLQDDGSSCGPFMIENLLLAAQNAEEATITSRNASYFRALHSEMQYVILAPNY